MFSMLMISKEYEEVIVPPAKPVPPSSKERLIAVSELDILPRGCFPVGVSHIKPRSQRLSLYCPQGYTSLNRIQSIVYPTAYGTNENMLICGNSPAQVRPLERFSFELHSSYWCCMTTTFLVLQPLTCDREKPMSLC